MHHIKTLHIHVVKSILSNNCERSQSQQMVIVLLRDVDSNMATIWFDGDCLSMMTCPTYESDDDYEDDFASYFSIAVCEKQIDNAKYGPKLKYSEEAILNSDANLIWFNVKI